MINLNGFEQSLKNNAPPQQASVYLQALWYDAKGDWNKAHSLVDGLEGSAAAAVHAYLHRVEGDNRNANYWYRRANKPMPDISLKEEWKLLVVQFLNGKHDEY